MKTTYSLLLILLLATACWAQKNSMDNWNYIIVTPMEFKQKLIESMNKVDSESAYKEFLRMENRIEEMETKAGSYAQFADQGAYAHLDYADEVEKEWQKLKRSKQLEKQPAN